MDFNADCLALPPDHFAKFNSTRVGNQLDLEPAWQNVYNFDNKFCAGSRQIAQAAFVVRQTMGGESMPIGSAAAALRV
jgi:hypothetical protein